MSTLRRYLSFYLLSLLHPRRRDFVSGGLGIEARYERCGSYWKRHLEHSTEFQDASIKSLMPHSLAVLGAGRLLDAPHLELLPPKSEVSLYDADPGCLPTWKERERSLRSLGIKVTPYAGDLTGQLDKWTREVRKNSSRAERALERLAIEKISFLPLSGYDLIISLNLMSQIPIYWEDRVTHCLGATRIEAVRTALEKTKAALEAAHIRQLAESRARGLVIISDRFFHYYEKSRTEWQTEEALHRNIKDGVPGYRVTRSDSWLWHIAPQGIEAKEYGIIHEVCALELVREA